MIRVEMNETNDIELEMKGTGEQLFLELSAQVVSIQKSMKISPLEIFSKIIETILENELYKK